MNLLFFSKPSEFRKWLMENHKTETELWVGYYKVNTGKPSITWSQSVDEALCFGWIDGVRKSIDNQSYCNRFTPRKPTSNWSAINIAKVDTLTKLGLMQASGIEAFNKRKEEKSRIYSFENVPKQLSYDFEVKFKASKLAWEFFSKQAPSFQRTVIHWINSAKKEETQLARFEKLIAESEKLKRIL